MNSTNSTNNVLLDPWFAYNDAVKTATSQGNWVTFGCSLIQVAILVAIVWKERQLGARTSDARLLNPSRIFSVVNVLLFHLIISNYLSSYFQQLANTVSDSNWVNILDTLTNFSCVLFNILPTLYTWVRGFPVVNNVAPWSKGGFYVLIAVCCTLQAATFILYTIAQFLATDPSFLIFAGASLSTSAQVAYALFDAAILYIFIVYLLRAIQEGFEKVDGRMTLIAAYGIASFVSYQAFVAAMLTYNYVYLLPSISETAFLLIYNLQQYLPIPYIFLQLLMKFHLHLEKERSIEAMRASCVTVQKGGKKKDNPTLFSNS